MCSFSTMGGFWELASVVHFRYSLRRQEVLFAGQNILGSRERSFPSRSLAPSRLGSTRGQSWAHFRLRGRKRNHQQPPPSLSFQNCPEQTDCCLIILQSLRAARLQELLLHDHCVYFRSVKRKPIICSSDGPILRVQQVLLPTCLMPWSRLSSVLQTDRLAEPTAATASSEHLTSPSLSLYFPSWKSLSRMYCTR